MQDQRGDRAAAPPALSLFGEEELRSKSEHRADPVQTRDSAIVRFEPSGRERTVPVGTLLLDVARDAGLPVAQSCGGFAICSWCRMQVLHGEAGLSPVEADEARLIRREEFAANERASCQARVMGNVTVTTKYW